MRDPAAPVDTMRRRMDREYLQSATQNPQGSSGETGPERAWTIEGEIVRCAGICSHVPYPEDEGVYGHILMLDYDDHEAGAMEVIGDLQRSDGVSVLLQSSPGSYHGYVLSLDGFNARCRHAAAKHGEMAHVRQSARRGYFVLRWTSKIHAAGPQEGEIYKDAPSIMHVSLPDDLQREHSRPHLETLLEQAREDAPQQAKLLEQARDRLAEQDLLVGESLPMDRYESATDRLKEAVRTGAIPEERLDLQAPEDDDDRSA